MASRWIGAAFVAVAVFGRGEIALAQSPPPARPASGAVSSSRPTDEETLQVRARVEPVFRTAGTYDVPVGALEIVPRIDPAEIVTLVPGVALSNESNTGDPPEMYLRGFGGDNGSDIAFSLGGVPLNDESNPRTHGLADLSLLLPELVDGLDATEGVADPRQGNFALAGSVDVRLGLAMRGVSMRGSMGSDGYRRLVALYGPAHRSRATFVGWEIAHADGFGPARSYDRVNALGQDEFALGHGLSLRVLVALGDTRWTSPGVLREDDVRAGRIDFFGAYPGLGAQGGRGARALVAGTLGWSGSLQQAELLAYAQLRSFASAENFTGFLVDPVHGDLQSDRYDGGTLGARAFYRRQVRIAGRLQDAELGLSFRYDRFGLSERHLDAATNSPLVPPDPGDQQSEISVANPAAWLAVTVRALDWIALRGGVRADVMTYDLTTTAFDRTVGAITTARNDAVGLHVGPKASLDLGGWRGLHLVASVGTGFRSPDARDVTSAGGIPFASVTTEDVAVRYSLSDDVSDVRVLAALDAFHTTVDRDSIFDPTRGTTVDVGPTDRLGVVAWARVRPLAWIDVATSVAYTHASVQTASLGGTLAPGAAIPYLPAVVGRLDAAMDRSVGTWRDLPIRVRAGVGASVRGPVPMIATGETDPVVLIDARVGARMGPVSFDLAGRNLLDARWRSAEFEYASNFDPHAAPDTTAARHLVAGAPLTVIATVGIDL